MAVLSHVTIETKPTHGIGGVALYEWPQPWLNGDDQTDWSVTDQAGTTRKVQRDRLTDEVMWCSVLADLGGTSGFTVDTGTIPTPATGWTAPNLTGLKLRWTWAHDGSVHEASFTDTTHETILRDGHNVRQVRRYMLSKVSTVGTSNLVLNEGVLCHHVYLTFRADLPNVIKCEIRMSNAAAEVQTDAASIAARGGGIKSSGTTQLNSIGFSDCDLILPTVGTWECIQDRPVNAADHTQIVDASTIPPIDGAYTSDAHCFPRKMAAIRRFVLYKTSAGATLQQAQDLLAFKGLGRCDRGPAGSRSYHSVRAYGPSKSLLPRLDLGYTGGYAAATSQCVAQWTALNNAVLAGTNTFSSAGGGEFGQGTGSARFGLFHFVGSQQVDEQGGGDIGPFCGAVRHVPAFVRFASLYGGMKVDGCGIFLYERTTGRPLRGRDFAEAYAGGAVAHYTGGAAFAGIRQPFNFYCQTNSGYEYRGTGQEDFAGWTRRDNSWPPHYLGVDGSGNPKWWPDRTSLWGTAPRSNWDFKCDYRPLLEYVPVSTSPDASPHPAYQTPIPHLEGTPFTSSGNQCWKDPEDTQHSIRMFRYLIPLAWLGGDLLSIDVIDMFAEYFALEYADMKYLNLSSTDPFSLSVNNRSLGRRTEINAANPNEARYYNGRAEAWVAYLFAAQFALTAVTDRDEGYPALGIKARARMMFDNIRQCVITENGMTMRAHTGDIFGILSPYAAAGYSGQPIPTTYAVMQAGLELPKVFLGYWSLLKQLESGLPDASIAQAQAHCVTAWREFVARTTLYLIGVSVGSPYNWVATWNDTTNTPEPGDTIWRGPNGQQEHWQDVCSILEVAYRCNGDTATLQTANYLGGPVAPNTPPQARAPGILNANSDYAPGLVALMQSLAGADEEFAPPSISPQISLTVSSNPATQGATVTFTATVTPGANPTSISYTVTCNLAEFGGSAAEPMTEASPGVFEVTFDTTDTFPSSHSVSATVVDDQGRADTDSIPFTVAAQSTAPTCTLIASPSPVVAGSVLTLFCDVVLGTAPPSTGVLVTVDLTAFGLSSTTPMLDGGVAPDVTAADLRFTCAFTPTAGFEGTYTLTAKVIDDQLRTAMGDATVKVSATPVAGSDPSVILRVNANPITAGNTITLTALVTKSTDGASITSVFVDLTALGGPASFELLDDGIAPDVTALDLTYTGSYATSAALATSTYSLPCVVLDRVGRTGSDKLGLAVNAVVDPTDPLVFGSASPNPVTQTANVTFSALVVPGTAPASTVIAVDVDLTPLGDGVRSMVNVGGDNWEYTTTIGLNDPAGRYSIEFHMSDAQLRNAYDTITLYVAALVPSGQGDAFLPVYDGADILAVPLNAAERLEITDETGAVFEIQNSPNVSASNGGQLPVLLGDGVTTILVPFIVLEVPQGPVVVGTATGGERRTRPQSTRELVGAG